VSDVTTGSVGSDVTAGAVGPDAAAGASASVPLAVSGIARSGDFAVASAGRSCVAGAALAAVAGVEGRAGLCGLPDSDAALDLSSACLIRARSSSVLGPARLSESSLERRMSMASPTVVAREVVGALRPSVPAERGAGGVALGASATAELVPSESATGRVALTSRSTVAESHGVTVAMLMKAPPGRVESRGAFPGP